MVLALETEVARESGRWDGHSQIAVPGFAIPDKVTDYRFPVRKSNGHSTEMLPQYSEEVQRCLEFGMDESYSVTTDLLVALEREFQHRYRWMPRTRIDELHASLPVPVEVQVVNGFTVEGLASLYVKKREELRQKQAEYKDKEAKAYKAWNRAGIDTIPFILSPVDDVPYMEDGED